MTIASWPIFAGVLLAVMVALGGQGAIARSYLECLVAALVLLVTALSTPALASHVVGGALQNFAGAGFALCEGAGHRDGVGARGAVAAAQRAAEGAWRFTVVHGPRWGGLARSSRRRRGGGVPPGRREAGGVAGQSGGSVRVREARLADPNRGRRREHGPRRRLRPAAPGPQGTRVPEGRAQAP